MEYKPGINHIELWVSNQDRANSFYDMLFELYGWRNLHKGAWSCGHLEIYLREEKATSRILSLGVHHLCLQATSREMIDKVAEWIKSIGAEIFNGPKDINHYSEGYYTIDFYDPDGFVLEVAHTPNREL